MKAPASPSSAQRPSSWHASSPPAPSRPFLAPPFPGHHAPSPAHRSPAGAAGTAAYINGDAVVIDGGKMQSGGGGASTQSMLDWTDEQWEAIRPKKK
jgi:hypothetical protein